VNFIDIPGIAIATPLIGIELWYWRMPFETRGRRIKLVEGWLILLLLVFVVVRIFTTWGEMNF